MAGAAGLALAAVAPASAGAAPLTAAKSPLSTTDEPATPLKDVTSYNNFYEFGVDKDDPAKNAHTLTTKPWTVKVDGLVGKPADYNLEDLVDMAALEERIYRMRCVEGWSMVIPWIGVPLATILKKADPQGSAKYVAFETLVRPAEMPGQKGFGQPLPWPYVEGLRMDEAMHPLAIMAVGLYGETLMNQNGAPFRLVVPWKYGFKSIKSVVRISLVEKQPPTTWKQGQLARVRLLFQRQSGRRPSALEPGERAAHRRERAVRQAAPDAALQRLRRPSRGALLRARPQSQLLKILRASLKRPPAPLFASPCIEGAPSMRRGGRKMHPRFRLAVTERAADSTASLNRWMHQVGVTGGRTRR